MTDELDDKRKQRTAEREQLKLARRIAAKAEATGVIRDWLDRRDAQTMLRDGELKLPDHDADLQAIQARLRARALVILEDIMVYSPIEAHQLRACEIATNMGALTIVQLPAATGPADVRAEVVQQPSAAPDVEKIHALLVMRNRQNRNGGT